MVRPRISVVATGVLLLSAVSVAPATGSVASAATVLTIAFSTPSIVDPVHTYGEPDILVDPTGHGRVYASGPTGTGTQRSVWNASVDGGQTYRLVTQGAPPSALIGNPAPQPGGGDTELAADHTGKTYFGDLYALTCLRVATTTDHGATTQQNVYPGGCAGVPGADRHWMAVFDPPGGQTQSTYRGPFPLMYMEYNDLGADPFNLNATGSAQWVKSLDGLTYSRASLGGEFGADGYPSIDQVTGKVFQAEYDRSGGSSCGTAGSTIFMNVGTPDATGQLTFLDDPNSGSTANLIPVAHGVPDNTGEAANFLVSSMDAGRNLWVAWVGRSCDPSQRQVWVSVASAASGWTNWSKPAQVSAPPSQVAIFPWIKAGGAGRADVVWYGSDLLADPSSDAGQNWDVYMSQVVFPTVNQSYVSGVPTSVQQVKVTPHPMHFNSACLQGTACIASQGNRNLADFFEVTIDKSGAAEIVYDDTSNLLCQQNPPITPNGNQTLDHCGAPLVSVARQSQGPGLYANITVSGPSNAPISGQPDNRGDALDPVIGGANVPGMDILSNQLELNASRQTLTVTERFVDLSNPTLTVAQTAPSGFLQYVTRWQMGNTIYFAQMENTPANAPMYFAGKAESIDLCSVSACFPHVITYPEPALQQNTSQSDVHAETGNISCPPSPSASNPCTLTITVKLADIGAPSAASLLEEVGSYSFASTHPAGFITNAQAQEDNVPLEIDGVCCFNFKASVANGGPPPCHEGDGDGQVQGARSGNATFRVDQDACEDRDAESVDVSDSGSGTDFHSSQIQSVSFDDVANSMTVVGAGTNAGHPVTFTMVALNGPAGIGTFSLILSDGYAVNGTLQSGSIQLQ
jgi:hypothetical protein